jgi:hypothetical protein
VEKLKVLTFLCRLIDLATDFIEFDRFSTLDKELTHLISSGDTPFQAGQQLDALKHRVLAGKSGRTEYHHVQCTFFNHDSQRTTNFTNVQRLEKIGNKNIK